MFLFIAMKVLEKWSVHSFSVLSYVPHVIPLDSRHSPFHLRSRNILIHRRNPIYIYKLPACHIISADTYLDIPKLSTALVILG